MNIAELTNSSTRAQMDRPYCL